MYITKQAEQEIYLIAKKNYAGAPPKIHTQLPKLAVGALSYLSGLTNFESRLGQLFENGLKKTTGVRGRHKKEKETTR